MTDLWLHVNTFFIIVLIFFRYSSHIKKYMAAYFICLRKLSFCGAGAFKFILLFLKFFLPGTVKAVSAKLCAVFLCTLLKRLQFSPQNVGFWTKSARENAMSGSPQAARHCSNYKQFFRCNNDDRRQRRKQGGVVGAAASKTRVPPKARCGCWVPQPGRRGAHFKSSSIRCP